MEKAGVGVSKCSTYSWGPIHTHTHTSRIRLVGLDNISLVCRDRMLLSLQLFHIFINILSSSRGDIYSLQVAYQSRMWALCVFLFRLAFKRIKYQLPNKSTNWPNLCCSNHGCNILLNFERLSNKFLRKFSINCLILNLSNLTLSYLILFYYLK